MKDTIKADNGYIVKYLQNKKTKERTGFANVYDGEKHLFTAEMRTYEDYKDEVLQGNNECAGIMEIFTTKKGNQFIYWVDYETNEDFLTKIEK